MQIKLLYREANKSFCFLSGQHLLDETPLSECHEESFKTSTPASPKTVNKNIFTAEEMLEKKGGKSTEAQRFFRVCFVFKEVSNISNVIII